MLQNRIAKRYAKALYDLSEDKNVLKKVNGDVKTLSELYNFSSDFRLFAESSTISSQEKETAVLAIAEKSGFNDLLINFLCLLAKKKRFDIVFFVMEEFFLLLDKKNNIVDAVLETVIEIDEKQERKIILYLEQAFGKRIRIKKQLNKSIGGGFKIRIDDKMVDGSIAYQLKRLYSQLVSA